MNMKKLVVVLLALALMLSLCACGGEKKAFEKSKEAYDLVTTAYTIADEFGSDLYEGWRMAIYDKDEMSLSYLSEELDLPIEELEMGVAAAVLGDDFATATDEEKKEYTDDADLWFDVMYDDGETFSACIWVVTGTYEANGKVEEAKAALEQAKALMKELSEKHSDYEHYPNLKGYYTTTGSMFDFCRNPEGSFEQVKDTINDYRNEARDYVSDLDYIFEN